MNRQSTAHRSLPATARGEGAAEIQAWAESGSEDPTIVSNGHGASSWKFGPRSEVGLGVGTGWFSSCPQQQHPPQQAQPSVEEPVIPLQQWLGACRVAGVSMPWQQQQVPAVPGRADSAPRDGQWQENAVSGCNGIATATSSIMHFLVTAKRIISCAVVIFPDGTVFISHRALSAARVRSLSQFGRVNKSYTAVRPLKFKRLRSTSAQSDRFGLWLAFPDLRYR